jgi:NRAMP (natural resistance-associated macrophage protein)-like metal ion transporter
MKRGRTHKKKNLFRHFFSALGPGLVTGAADDDPSGIATYTIAGAQLGTALLWTAVLTWPLMGCVQFVCARIGMVTGIGLGAALKKKIPHWMLVIAAFALFGANSINIGADLLGMADAGEMLAGVNSHFLIIIFGIGIAFWTVRCSYDQIAAILKWLALCLFAYVVTALVVKPDWSTILHDTFVPGWPKDHATWQNLVAILGTTISPYLFFWQSSQEVETEKTMGRRIVVQRRNATRQELIDRKLDVGTGTFFSNFVMYFIILTAAATLHRHGMTRIETSRQAAEALRPLAGTFAYFLYAAGLIGVGLLAVPTLSGSAAYAFAETFNWRQGLDEKLAGAPAFYIVVIFSICLGIAMDFLKVNPVTALFWTAVINGVLAPFLLAGILFVASDKRIMRHQPASLLSRIVVGIALLAMFVAAIAMFVL